MPTVLISGSANGLGAAFVGSYSPQSDTKIIAIDRFPTESNRENIIPFEVDVASDLSVDSFVGKIKDLTIDLVIHCAGVRGLVLQQEDRNPNDVAACETRHVMDLATLTRAFTINAAGTFMLLRALVPNLQKSADPKVIVMSSRMGSVGNNQLPNKDAGSAYAYRASKAALNAIVRSFAVDLPDITFVLCHPGRVETKLVRRKEEGAISARESINDMRPLIDGWGKNDSGKFFDRFGKTIPW